MSDADRAYKLEDAVVKATQAEAELKLLGEAFQKLRADLVKAWEATDPRDQTGREKLWIATTQLTQVERTLRNVVNSGVVAKKELDAIKNAGAPRKPFLRRLV